MKIKRITTNLKKQILFPIFIIIILAIKIQSQSNKILTEETLLSNEITHPIKGLHLLSESDQNLKRLIFIIGLLPEKEQEALFEAYLMNKDNSRLFNPQTYLKEMIGNGKDEISIIKYITQTAASNISKGPKWLRKGLGCILRISNKFYSTQTENSYDQIVLKSLNDLMNAQIQANNCRARFGSFLNKLLQNRRKFLLTSIENQMADGVFNDPNKKNYIIGFKYTLEEIKELIENYTNYAICEHSFNSAVYSRVLESQQTIAQMSSCKGEINDNLLNYQNEYKNLHNFQLNGGLKLGIGRFEFNSNGTPQWVLNIEIKNSIKQLLSLLTVEEKKDESWADLEMKIRLNLSINLSHRFTPHLHYKILSGITNLPDDFLAEFLKGERGDKCESNDYLVYCDSELCKCVGSKCPSSLTSPLKITWKAPMEKDVHGYVSENKNFSWNFNYLNSYVAVFCLDNARYIYSQATDTILGNVIDYIATNQKLNGKLYNMNLGASYSLISQGCFNSFSDGIKNEKDSCRDVLNEKCAQEMDQSCKISQLYDYLAVNPVPSKTLPFECDLSNLKYNTLECAGWINKNFIGGSMTLKPSGFFVYGLRTQSSQNYSFDEQNIKVNNLNYFTPNIETMPYSRLEKYNSLKNYTDSINNEYSEKHFKIDEASVNTFPYLEDYLNDIAESSYLLNFSERFGKMSLFYSIIFLFIYILF